MSKFVEKLQRSYKTTAPPLGFHKNTDVEENQVLLLIADITKSTVKAIKDIYAGGADAVVINCAGMDAAALAKFSKNGGQVPVGLMWDDSTTITPDEASSAKIDFIAYDVRTPVETMHGESPGKFIKIDSTLIPGLVKAVNDLNLNVDGVIVTTPGDAVTVESLLVCKLFSDILSKPLLFAANSKLSYNELESLYNAGASGVLLPPGISAGDIGDMKKSIARVPKKTKRKSALSPILPGLAASAPAPSRREEPDEDDDEDI
jgi:hypothetical protein